MSKETFKEFVSNMNPESLEKTRLRMEEEIKRSAIQTAAKKYVEQFGYDREEDELAIDFAIGDFIAGAEFMYKWMQKEFVVARKSDFVELPLYMDGNFLTIDKDFTDFGYKEGDVIRLMNQELVKKLNNSENEDHKI